MRRWTGEHRKGESKQSKMAKDMERKSIRRQVWRGSRLQQKQEREEKQRERVSAKRRSRPPRENRQRSREPSQEVVSSLPLEVCKQGCMNL